ncbi:MAG: PAS domain S-box protein [Beijerinckiaceae bacterium]|nr:PAS domain S-box protein [Beijerinckiaceae bacterium]
MTQNFKDLIADEVVQSLDLESAIVMLWALEGDRILAASQPAIRLFGGFKAEDLTGRRFGPALPSTARLAELSRHLAVDEPARVERLRFFLGSRSDVLTCLCQRVRLRTGGEALLVISKDQRHLPTRRPALQSWTPPDEPLDPALAIDRPANDAVPATAPATPQPARRPVRFVFQMDADGRVQSVSPQLAEAVGARGAAIAGYRIAELQGAIGLEGAEPIAERIASGDGWQGVEIRWPAGEAGSVPVEISGLPIRDAARHLVGFRGFGVVRLDLAALPQETDESTEEPAKQIPDEHHASEAAIISPAMTSPTVPAPALPSPASPTPASPTPAKPEPSNIVPLNLAKPGSETAPPAKAETIGDDRLSPSERNAFREIAKALGARLADDMPEPPGRQREARPAEQAAATEPAPPTVPAMSGHASRPAEPTALALPAPPESLLPPPPDAQTPDAQTPVEEDSDHAGPDTETDAEPIAAAHDDDQAVPALDVVNETSAGVEPPPAEPHASDAATEVATASLTDTAGTQETSLPDAENDTEHDAEPAELDHLDGEDGFALIDRLPIGVMIVDGDRPVFMNRTLLGLTGLDHVPDHPEPASALFAEPVDFEALAEAPVEASLKTGDGDIMRVSALGDPILWRGRPALLVSMRSAAQRVMPATPEPVTAEVEPLSDTRESLGLRQGLRTAETERDEFKAILDTATDGVISLDAEGRIIGLNRSAEALFGYDQNEVAGQRFSTLFAGESHASALDYLQGLKMGGVASVLNDGREVVGREKKGGRIPLFMTLGRISDRDGGRFCAVLRDLTAWKKAEAELTESKRVAERASAMKSDFLAKISHEIRTPMNAIIGFSEVMRTEQFGPIGSERYREYLGDIHRSGEHVISLVNDLLDLSKIEAGRADLSFTSVNLNDIVQDCISMMQPQAARERVILRSNLSDHLPAVVADERSIKQVVLNLLSNACKFNQPGGQVIISTALSDEGEAVIRVRDTGIGMSEKDIEGAMQPFRQMSPTRRGGGTGLGLPLSKALVEANRANLAIRSAVNEGTLAEVTFPATRVLAE